jgi:8-hydroxy-5-deazaflavin:NADPH oxidoreductase
MKIAIIGAGHVGGTLGIRWEKDGHEVIFGVRHPDSPKVRNLLDSADHKVKAMGVREAVAAAPLVVLAIPWSAAKDAIEAAGKLEGKILVDCTNPLKEDLSGLALGHSTSAAEQIAGWASGAKVVKAFNSTGAKNMLNPHFPSGDVSMFICGDDAETKKTVAGLVSELGFEAVDVGALTMARYLEPLAMLWVQLAYAQGWGPDFGFKLLKR